MPELFDLIGQLKSRHDIAIASFGHAGDGNIHVNFMIAPGNADARARATAAERELFDGVVRLEGSISGEHGIGFAKAKYLPIKTLLPFLELAFAIYFSYLLGFAFAHGQWLNALFLSLFLVGFSYVALCSLAQWMPNLRFPGRDTGAPLAA